MQKCRFKQNYRELTTPKVKQHKETNQHFEIQLNTAIQSSSMSEHARTKSKEQLNLYTNYQNRTMKDITCGSEAYLTLSWVIPPGLLHLSDLTIVVNLALALHRGSANYKWISLLDNALMKVHTLSWHSNMNFPDVPTGERKK